MPVSCFPAAFSILEGTPSLLHMAVDVYHHRLAPSQAPHPVLAHVYAVLVHSHEQIACWLAAEILPATALSAIRSLVHSRASVLTYLGSVYAVDLEMLHVRWRLFAKALAVAAAAVGAVSPLAASLVAAVERTSSALGVRIFMNGLLLLCC